MTPASSPVFFRSDLFPIDPQEDEETNPFCYGKSLAEWVRARFNELGYESEPVIAEDWGWCVMLQRKPFMLWVGCGNDRSEFYDKVTPEKKSSYVPDGKSVMWSCLVGTDAPVWTPFFWKRLFGQAGTQEQVAAVTRELQSILNNEPRIQVVRDEAA
jgi:hypothetical protein